MRPFYPNHQNPQPQPQPPSTGFVPQQQQGMGIPNNLMQMQSQMGYMNPRLPNPVNLHNPNVGAVDVLQVLQGLMNLSNQNGHLGNSNLGSGPPMMHAMQSHQGFGQPNLNLNLNALSGILGQLGCLAGNFDVSNLSQCSGQFNALNQNGGYQNGLFGCQSQLQSVTHMTPLLCNLPLPNPSQAAPFASMMLPCVNQAASQGMVPPNNAFVASQQFGHGQAIESPLQKNLPQHNLVSSVINPNSFNQQPASQIQGNSPSSSVSASSITQQKGNFGKRDGMHIFALGRNQNKNFRHQPKHEVPRQRSHAFQNDHLHNARGNHCLSNQNGTRGARYDGWRASGIGNSASPSKGGKPRSLAIPYTDREIQQWREERKKHYPTESNIKKKLANKQTNAVAVKNDDKLWRQQLKDVLAKQVELGFEVPEIPPNYLSDSDGQPFQHEQTAKPFNNNRFQNSHNKLGRFKRHKQLGEKRDLVDKRSFGKHLPSPKRRRFNSDDQSHFTPAVREPTLLQKLLSADIRREKSHLLQAFRFMVMNSFFKDWPETPLKFPRVMVNEAGSLSEVIEGADALREEAGLMTDGTVGVCIEVGDGDDNKNQDEKECGSFGRRGRNHQER